MKRARAKKGVKTVWTTLKATYLRWIENDPFRLSAVVAYYAVFSMPGLFLIIFYLAGQFFGDEVVQHEVYGQLSGIIGPEGARQVEATITQASLAQKNIIATIIGIGSLIYAATGAFFHLKISINDIWELKVLPERAFKQVILDRLFSFGMVLVLGFLLLVSLIVSSLVSAVSTYFTNNMVEYSTFVIDITNFGISLLVITLLFGSIYKILPDAHVAWSDVLIGALATAVLFLAGKALITKYIGIADPASAYGAASSIILILLWTSYASLIFFFGASFTAVYAHRYGRKIEPKSYAIPVYEYYRRISHKGQVDYVKVESEKVKKFLDDDYETNRLTDEGEKPPRPDDTADPEAET